MLRSIVFALAVIGPISCLSAQEKKTKEVWTDPADKTLPIDFSLQGEYVGSLKGGDKLGAQVIALGKGAVQVVLLPGGLPGDGWDGKHKSLLAGKIEGDSASLSTATGKRKYLAGPADEFSATSKFPPEGQFEATAVLSGSGLTGKTAAGATFELKKVVRKSPTLGATPPPGAIVLFNGKDTSEWKGGRLDSQTGLLNTDGKDIVSNRKFQNYHIHVEFLLPYRPDARGQGRGNSGFYQVHHYEVQILDSFGLEGKNNETGGVYSRLDPKLNACLPPLTWQTYDVDFTNAVRDENANKVAKKARLTVKLNGIVVQDDVEIPGPTGGHRMDPEGTPGPVLLQGHGNPLQFRNIWVVEKK